MTTGLHDGGFMSAVGAGDEGANRQPPTWLLHLGAACIQLAYTARVNGPIATVGPGQEQHVGVYSSTAHSPTYLPGDVNKRLKRNL